MPNLSHPPVPQSLTALAQAGDVRALEGLLEQSIADPRLRFEVARRGHTLYVFLTVAGGASPATYASAVYDTIADLSPHGLDRLEVIDGTNRPQVDRWRQPFYLPTSDWTTSPPASDCPPPSPNPEPLAFPAVLVTPQPPLGDRATALVDTLARSRRIKQGLALVALVGLGLGLGAAVAQWRYGQPNSLAVTTLSAEVSPQPGAVDPAAAPLDAAPTPDSYLEELTDPAAARSAASLDAEANPVPPQFLPIFAPHRLSALNPGPLPTPTTLTINAVGDVIPGTNYRTTRLPQDWQYLLGGIQHQLQQADIVFGNFESTLTEVRSSPKDTGRPNVFAFRTPPWYASVLKVAGFTVMSVANNHAFDFGEQGFADTIANLEQEGISAVGRKGEIVYTEAKGLTVAFIGFSYLNQHNTVHDLDTAAALVQEANQNADIVVVSFHAGKEGSDATAARDQTEYFFSENRGNVVRFSRTVVDHGADLVLGHGPHVPRALEVYNNKLIAYSLGNFLGYRTLATAGHLGTSLILTANLDSNGDFIGGRIVPVTLDRNGVPALDDHFKSVVLIRSLTRHDFPDTPLTIDDDGYLWPTP